MNISFENVSKVSALLTLNIEKADYADRVKKALKDFSKKASIPGFRAGKVPASLIEKRFGTEIKAEEINKILGEEVNKYIEMLQQEYENAGKQADIIIGKYRQEQSQSVQNAPLFPQQPNGSQRHQRQQSEGIQPHYIPLEP